MTHASAVVIAVASFALGGCGPDCILEQCDKGPPRVLQVFVTNAEADDTKSGLILAYGEHPDVLGGAPVTGVRATAVPRTGAAFHVVLSELVDGRTVEEFACAGGGWARSTGLDACAACVDHPATLADEKGKCLDENADRIPDDIRLVGAIATIRCPGRLFYTTFPGEGYYYASGNQFPTTIAGLAGLGPAIVLTPRITLPADADCTLGLNPGIEDRHGNTLELPGGVSFHTARE